MSEDSDATPTPWVVDVSVLTAVARGDYSIMSFIQHVDAGGRPLVIPALAITGASLDMRSEDAELILQGLQLLENAIFAPVHDSKQAIRLAAIVTRTGLDAWDAHVAEVADASVCPILTLNRGKWRHARDLEEPLHFIEIDEPDED